MSVCAEKISCVFSRDLLSIAPSCLTGVIQKTPNGANLNYKGEVFVKGRKKNSNTNCRKRYKSNTRTANTSLPAGE